MDKETNKKEYTLYSIIIKYFTEPFKKDYISSKDVIYYEEMRMRREWIIFWVIIIIIGIILISNLLNATELR